MCRGERRGEKKRLVQKMCRCNESLKCRFCSLGWDSLTEHEISRINEKESWERSSPGSEHLFFVQEERDARARTAHKWEKEVGVLIVLKKKRGWCGQEESAPLLHSWNETGRKSLSLSLTLAQLIPIQRPSFRFSLRVCLPCSLFANSAQPCISDLVLPQLAHQPHTFIVVARHTFRWQEGGRDLAQALSCIRRRGSSPAKLRAVREHKRKARVARRQPRLAHVRKDGRAAQLPFTIKAFYQAAQRRTCQATAVQLHFRAAGGLQRDDRRAALRHREGAEWRPQRQRRRHIPSRQLRGVGVVRHALADRASDGAAVEGEEEEYGDGAGKETPRKTWADMRGTCLSSWHTALHKWEMKKKKRERKSGR